MIEMAMGIEQQNRRPACFFNGCLQFFFFFRKITARVYNAALTFSLYKT
jgi:hypothetical protein